MAARWDPVPVILRFARAIQRRIAGDVAASAPRAEHRDGTALAGYDKRGQAHVLRSLLVERIKAPGLVEKKPWGAVLRLQSLGQIFLWFRRGTEHKGRTRRTRGGGRKRTGGVTRQPPRPVDLSVDVEALTRELEADAAGFLQNQERAA